MQQRTCKCGALFVVPHPSSKKLNCSAKCRGVKSKRRADAGQRRSEWVDLHCPCGQTFQVPQWEARGSGRKYCSSACRLKFRTPGSGRPRRDDRVRYIDDQGYVRVYVPPADRPGGSWARKSHHPEHRVVMSQLIGRHLLPGENVHHRNGVRADNRAENLELWTTKQPRGLRAVDALAWAREIISLYADVEDALWH